MSKAIVTKKRAEKQMITEREFPAPREKVWQAWTESDLRDQWWAPKPWKAATESFDFSEGGHWHYSMNGPAGEKIFAWVGYFTIDPKNRITAEDAFCDATGKKTPDMPVMLWEIEFSDAGVGTKVIVTTTFASEADMDTILSMGVEEGFTMALDNLEAILTA